MKAISLTEPVQNIAAKPIKTFRLTYILLPVVLFLAAITLAVTFYNRLPPEVVYRYTEGTSVSRGAIIAWLVVPQFILALIGIGLSGIGAMITRKNEPSDRARMTRLLMVMGNMVALPQLILLFALLEILLYNAYQIRLIPLWTVIVVVMLIGSIVLGIFFLKTLKQSRGSDVKNYQE